MTERKKILFISDHPLVPSGVGIQSKYLIEGLLNTEKYKFMCLGGALKHDSMQPQHIAPDKFGDGNWLVQPVNGHGDPATIRAFIKRERPDALVFVTDPRFYQWLWDMEDEVRAHCPMLYWHVWDNDPSPDYNLSAYESTDYIGCISLKTYGILQDLGYKTMGYIPHALPDELFKPLPKEDTVKFKEERFGPHKDKKFIVMWNNRNARRKQTGDVIACFAKFAEKVGKENVALLLHTAVNDPEGQDVIAVAKKFDIGKNVIISDRRVSPEDLNRYYNVADVTINIASNEGFGLSTLESMYSGTPIIVHMTGGLQFQIGDWWVGAKDFTDQAKLEGHARKEWNARRGKWAGVPVFTSSRSCTGSQQIPYIYDDRVCHDDVVKALIQVYEMGKEERAKLGETAREWALESFSMDNMISQWDKALTETIDNFVPVGMRKAVI